jgi:hypothetical protein
VDEGVGKVVTDDVTEMTGGAGGPRPLDAWDQTRDFFLFRPDRFVDAGIGGDAVDAGIGSDADELTDGAAGPPPLDVLLEPCFVRPRFLRSTSSSTKSLSLLGPASLLLLLLLLLLSLLLLLLLLSLSLPSDSTESSFTSLCDMPPSDTAVFSFILLWEMSQLLLLLLLRLLLLLLKLSAIAIFLWDMSRLLLLLLLRLLLLLLKLSAIAIFSRLEVSTAPRPVSLFVSSWSTRLSFLVNNASAVVSSRELG